MKKIAALYSLFLVLGCASATKTTESRPLYEVLTQKSYGGASIRFFEVLTEEKEMAMLLGDSDLKNKVKSSDAETSNFVILNMGEKTSGGYSIGVEKVEEHADKIVITVKETSPKPGENVTMALTNPYAVVRINSKKPVEIK